MKIDQTTIDAVNNALADAGLVSMRPNGETSLPALYAADVSALLLALAKCEPVLSLVEALRLVSKRGEMVQISDEYMFEVLDAARAALAPFAGGGE